MVLFGEDLPEDVMDHAMSQVLESNLVIVIGSSLNVQPASLLPLMAKSSGANLVFINLQGEKIFCNFFFSLKKKFQGMPKIN